MSLSEEYTERMGVKYSIKQLAHCLNVMKPILK